MLAKPSITGYGSSAGYGHQAPTTPQGRMVCLVYAIIGIPLNAILIGSLGSVFSDKESILWEIHLICNMHMKEFVVSRDNMPFSVLRSSIYLLLLCLL